MKERRRQIMQQKLKIKDTEMGHILALYPAWPEMALINRIEHQTIWDKYDVTKKEERERRWYWKRKTERGERRMKGGRYGGMGRDRGVMWTLKAFKIQPKRACLGIRQQNYESKWKWGRQIKSPLFIQFLRQH